MGFTCVAGNIVLWRRDLFRDAVFSGSFLALITFLIYLVWLTMYPSAFHDFWMLHNVSGIFVVGIPIEELLYTFTWGSLIGPLYELVAGLRLRKISTRLKQVSF